LKSFGCATEMEWVISAITYDERDHGETGARLRVLQQEQEPTGKVQSSLSRAPAVVRAGRPLDRAATSGRSSRGSRTRLRTSISKLAKDHAHGETRKSLRERIVVSSTACCRVRPAPGN
jgi:hypothetical protein